MHPLISYIILWMIKAVCFTALQNDCIEFGMMPVGIGASLIFAGDEAILKVKAPNLN